MICWICYCRKKWPDWQKVKREKAERMKQNENKKKSDRENRRHELLRKREEEEKKKMEDR
jgi:hypothetical protein